MDSLNFPGTFFIVTGELKGSEYQSKFIGRSVKDIIAETKGIATSKENFFNRASAVGFPAIKAH